MTSRASRRIRRRLRRFRRRHPQSWVVGPIAVLLLLLCGAIFTLNTLSARADLRHAQVSAQLLQQSIVTGDKPAARKALDSLQASTHGAHRSTDNILWKIASWVPFAGKNVSAVRKVAESLDVISSSALPSVVDIATQLDLNSFSPKDGKVDLAALAGLNTPVARANAVMADQASALADIRPQDLAGPVRGRVVEFITRIDQAADATRITHQALDLIPTMLGPEKRRYLVVFQNNAEIRATGGLPGSYLIANVKNGKISRGEQGTGSEVGVLKKAPVPLTSAERAIYPDLLGRLFIDTNFTPEFPRTAQFMQAILSKQKNLDIDGVISIDPVAMSYLLAGTGPVKLKDGTVLTSANAVPELLNKSYLRFPLQNQSDDFFKDAAAKLFDFVTEGHGDTGQTIRGLVRAAKENRILLWSDRAAEQRQIETMEIGATLTPDKKNEPSLGIFLNDATGTKLDYYLRYGTTVTPGVCSKDGSRTIEARIDLASLAPFNAALLPPSIVTDLYGVKKGNMQFTVRYYLPTGAKLLSVRTDTNTLGVATRKHNGHQVYGIPFNLKPGVQAYADVVFRTAPGDNQQLTLRTTPSVQSGQNVVLPSTVCD